MPQLTPTNSLAITLAELCVQTDGPLVERAWACVGGTYEYVEKHIADGSGGNLFRPIKRLMAKAQKVRQKHLEDVELRAKAFDFSRMELSDDTNLNKTQPPAMDFSSIPADAMNTLDVPPAWLKTPDIIQGTFVSPL